MPVFVDADGPPPVLPVPQWSEMSLTLLTWKAFCVAFAEAAVLLGEAEAPVGLAEFVFGFVAEAFPPEVAPEVLDTVAGCPEMETSCPTWLARSPTLPVRV